jgi:hypothetical protein
MTSYARFGEFCGAVTGSVGPRLASYETNSSRKRIGERARSDLAGESPAVLAPTARAFLTAIADDAFQ